MLPKVTDFHEDLLKIEGDADFFKAFTFHAGHKVECVYFEDPRCVTIVCNTCDCEIFEVRKSKRTHEHYRKKLTEKQQADVVNWYAETINEIEDVPPHEIEEYLENEKEESS